MRYTWIPRACATCDGDGTLVDGHANDPHAPEIECEDCAGTGYALGTCNECRQASILADGSDYCARCDRANWEEGLAERRKYDEREREMYEG